MVRKIVTCLMLSLVIVSTCSTLTTKAYDVYEAQPNQNITSVFRDIVSKIPLSDDYVFFRGGQYEYYLVTGDLTIDDLMISSVGRVKIYSIILDDNYSSNYTYNVATQNSILVMLNEGDFFYSNLGDYPDLIGYDTKYEIYQTIIIIIALLCVLVFRIFSSKR